MFIQHKGNRIRITKNAYSQKEKRTRVEINISFLINKLGVEFTDLPELVSYKCEMVRIETILSNDEIQVVQKWLDDKKIINRAENLQRDWARLPLMMKRLIDAFENGEIAIDDDQVARFNAFRDILDESISKRIAADERKMVAEGRKEALAVPYQKGRVLSTISGL